MSTSGFRPIYYLGGKSSLLGDISEAIEDVDPGHGRVCDLFSGTGVVGASLASRRPVTAIDIQEYARVLSSAMLNPERMSSSSINKHVDRALESPLFKRIRSIAMPLVEYEANCVEEAEKGLPHKLVEFLKSPPLNEVNGIGQGRAIPLHQIRLSVYEKLSQSGLWDTPDTTVLRHFGGVYFSYFQAIVLDALLSFSEKAAPESVDTLKAAALSVASQSVNTVGKQFAQPIMPITRDGAPKKSLIKIMKRDRSLDVALLYKKWMHKYSSIPDRVKGCNALCMDYHSGISKQEDISVIYADPPYTRDHYSRFYHVLETMCLRDNPEVSYINKGGKMVASRGYYRKERHQSPFCIRSKAPMAFESLFSDCRDKKVPLVLSYSPHEDGDGTHPRVLSMTRVSDIAKQYFNKVEILAIDGYTHNKLNRSSMELKRRQHAEIIMKCFIN